ncbi:MAG: DNA gyrase inhibitor YacG [Gammaproteobacteria bacterium]
MVKCPTCSKELEWKESEKWRPFCSERCRLIDLGSWADESNRIAGNKKIPPPQESSPEE